MKLPMRPQARPVGTHGAIRSVTCEETPAAHAREHRHRHQHAEQPAVEGHAALPDREHFERMRRVVAGLVEQHVAEPPADHHTEHAVEQQVFDVTPGPAGVGELRQLHALRAEPDEQAEGREVGQPVPVDGDGAELQRDRVELWVDEHGFGRKREAARTIPQRPSELRRARTRQNAAPPARPRRGQTRLVSHCGAAAASPAGSGR